MKERTRKMRKISPWLALLLVACNTNHSSDTVSPSPIPQPQSKFYCERQPQINPERGCHLSSDNMGCKDEMYNHGGCFEQTVAYCYTHSITGFEACLKYGYKVGDPEIYKCELDFHGWSPISTTTECDATLEECVSARNEIAAAKPLGKPPISSPPTLTLCRKSYSYEVIPY
jgi:hypothetical protein